MQLGRRLLSAAVSRQRVCVVQGASRGIGLELTQQLAEQGNVVFATCRAPLAATELVALQAAHPRNIVPLRLDVTEPDSIKAAAEAVAAHPLATAGNSEGAAVDLLLNTAGVLQDIDRGIKAERSLARVDASAAATSFAVNALGPLLTLQQFAPLLRQAAKTQTKASGTEHGKRAGSVVVFYSARVGSIGDNAIGGWHSYRASKAALNQFMRCSAVELRRHNVCCIALHPGTVDTDLTRAFALARAKYIVQDLKSAVSNHLAIFDSLSMDDSGEFLDWKQEKVPW